MEERRIFDEDGYDQNGYDKYGYNRNFEIDESSPISIISKHTLKILGYETVEEFRGDNGNLLYKYLLDLKEQKDTKTEIRYFVDQESAKEYKNEG